MAAILNEISIRKKLVAASTTRKQVNFYRNAALTRFNQAKNDMLTDFDEHVVTQELLQDPSEEGSELVSKGNLVSFLGLEDGSLEVGKIREHLRQNIELGDANDAEITEGRDKVSIGFPVYYPDTKELNQITEIEWTDKGLIDLIERGISNAQSYVFRSLGLPGSRSGFGLQRENPTKSGGTFTPKKWLSEIIAGFKAKFR